MYEFLFYWNIHDYTTSVVFWKSHKKLTKEKIIEFEVLVVSKYIFNFEF